MPSFVNIILNILVTGLPCCLLALGIFLTYRILDFADLTAEGSFLMGATVTAAMVMHGINPFVATLAGCGAGAVCGFITGSLNRFLKIPKLLSGIITMTGAFSIVMLIMGLANGTSSHFGNLMTLNIAPDSPQQTIYSIFWLWDSTNSLITAAVMATIVIIVMFGIYYFFGTEYGMAIRTTGLNENMARSQGINTTAASITGVTLSNALIGLGGSLYVQKMGSVGVESATGYLVIGLASILIGEAIFGKRSFKNWIISVSLGSIVYFSIIEAAIKLNVPSGMMKLLYAVLIVIALCLPAIKKFFVVMWFKFAGTRFGQKVISFFVEIGRFFKKIGLAIGRFFKKIFLKIFKKGGKTDAEVN